MQTEFLTDRNLEGRHSLSNWKSRGKMALSHICNTFTPKNWRKDFCSWRNLRFFHWSPLAKHWPGYFCCESRLIMTTNGSWLSHIRLKLSWEKLHKKRHCFVRKWQHRSLWNAIRKRQNPTFSVQNECVEKHYESETYQFTAKIN